MLIWWVLPLRHPSAVLAQRLSRWYCDRAAGGEEVSERAGDPTGQAKGTRLRVTRQMSRLLWKISGGSAPHLAHDAHNSGHR